ncbi:uncharacterized protein BJX67DRAFT_318651 [Aspergillus lucknowensis]|uniref:Uncharacterized protein n=1 Tax=Aspergillus lucknowensis TaxID=176173 RepID=A0ABR4L9X0_9EURO
MVHGKQNARGSLLFRSFFFLPLVFLSHCVIDLFKSHLSTSPPSFYSSTVIDDSWPLNDNKRRCWAFIGRVYCLVGIVTFMHGVFPFSHSFNLHVLAVV